MTRGPSPESKISRVEITGAYNASVVRSILGGVNVNRLAESKEQFPSLCG